MLSRIQLATLQFSPFRSAIYAMLPRYERCLYGVCFHKPDIQHNDTPSNSGVPTFNTLYAAWCQSQGSQVVVAVWESVWQCTRERR